MEYWVFFLLIAASVFGEYAIVFVHIGDVIPQYADIAISQARLFNPNAKIYLLASENALGCFEKRENIELYAFENLKKTSLHKEYDQECKSKDFWRFTSERFLYLFDLIYSKSLKNIFHLENDVMLYANLAPMLSQFQELYPGIAATFDNEDRAVPGFVWIKDKEAMKPLAKFFVQKAGSKETHDMFVFGKYRKARSRKWIDTLPIIMDEYRHQYPLESQFVHTTSHPETYSNHIDRFHGIFDAASIGQFLGGNDPFHQEAVEQGFINESCLFNPSHLDYEWLPDEQGRMVPFAIFRNQYYRIMNLHIHSKRLKEFRS